MNVKTTAKAIDDIADTLNTYSEKMRSHAASMITHNDITYASTALMDVTNCISNLRIDLLAARPIREFEKVVQELVHKRVADVQEEE